MIESILAPLVDLLGVLVGLAALSLSMWLIGVHRELFDTPYVAALYIVGTILVFLSFEVSIDPQYPIIFGRFVIYASVGYWEYVIFSEVRKSDDLDNLEEILQ